MKKTKRSKVTIEKERLLVISNPRLLEGYCQSCRAQVTMFGLKQAALLVAASQLEIFRRLENGSLHFVETPDGSLLICLTSLRQNFFGPE